MWESLPVSDSPNFAVTPPRHTRLMRKDPSVHSDSASPHLDASIAVWAERILATLRRVYSRQLREYMDADDAAQEYILHFLERAEVLMARHLSPEDLARAVAANHLRSWLRSQRSDAGEGARLFTMPDGSKRPGRTIVPLETGGADWVRSGDDVEYEVIEKGTTVREVGQALSRMRPAEAQILSKIYLQDRPRPEVCADLDCSPVALRKREERARKRFKAEFQPATSAGS
jgi:RNA polymerase sigma factor (sigma-70 family)